MVANELRTVAVDVDSVVIPDRGHYPAEEQPLHFLKPSSASCAGRELRKGTKLIGCEVDLRCRSSFIGQGLGEFSDDRFDQPSGNPVLLPQRGHLDRQWPPFR